MRHWRRWGKINTRFALILVLAAVGTGGTLFAIHRLNTSARSEQARNDGETAFGNGNWRAAIESYQEYLHQNPDDLPILRKYAQACLSVRPLDVAAINGAVWAYLHIVESDPLDERACEKLALIYERMQNFNDLASFARARLARDPNDRAAPLWLADALDGLNRPAEAQQVLQTFIVRLESLRDKYMEHTQACMRMSGLVAREAAAQPRARAEEADANDPPLPTALEWLDRAVAYVPDSVGALVSRAQFLRRLAETPGPDERDRPSLLIKARRDLEAADARGTDDARLLLLLGSEWLAQREWDRAAAVLATLDRMPAQSIEQSFPDRGDWIVARLLFALELAMRRERTAEMIPLVDDALAVPLEKGQRARILPPAIRVYVGAGRVDDARRCLDEYLKLVSDSQSPEGSLRHAAWLRALVAGAEDQPYTVINLMEPLVTSDASNPALWRLLAEAYDRTGQAGRAAAAWARYVRLNPKDAQAVRELARQYSKAGNWPKTLETAVVAESLGTADLPLTLLRIEAGIHVAAGQRGDERKERLQKLSAELTNLHRAQPDQVDIRILQFAVAEALAEPQYAENELKLAIAECKESLRARMELANFYLRARRNEEAITVCRTACRSHGTIGAPWLALADVHTAQGDYQSACRCLEEGLNRIGEASEKRTVSIKLAMVELLQGERTSAIGRLKALASQDAQGIQPRSLLLGIREIQEDPQTARKLLEELRQLEGEAGLWWRFRQASLWLSGRDWASRQEEIAGLLQHCIKADPAWSAPILLLTELYEKSGDYRRLEEICRQGLGANPSAADIADRLLTLLERQGRFADVQKVLQQLDLNPRFVDDWKIRGLWGAQDIARATDELKLRASNDERDARTRIDLARLVYQHSRDARQALEYLRQAESIDPYSPTLVALKASILKREGRGAESLRILGDYVAAHDEFNAFWVRGAYLAEDGRWDLAEKDYQRLTSFAANGAFGYELLGNFYAAAKRLDEGVVALERGLNVYPGDLRLSRRLMQLLLVRARPEDQARAMGLLDVLEEQMPQDVELLVLRARQMLQESSPQPFDAIAKRLENAVCLETGAVDAHLALMAIAMRREDYKAACNYATQALVANPGHPALLSARARAERALGYPERAVKFAREALRIDPDSQGALEVFVQTALAGGDRSLLDEVRVFVEASLDRDPDSESLLISYARVMTSLQMSNVGISRLEAYCLSGKGSGSITGLLTLAELYRLSGDAAKALTWIERAEQLNAASQGVVHARFLWLLSQERFTELAQISSRSKSAEGQNLVMVLYAASKLLGLGSIDLKRESVSLFEHAISQWPQSLDARLGLASSLYETGDIDRAEEIYRRSLDQHPNDIRILNDYAWLLQEHGGRYADALGLANRGLRLAAGDSDRVYLLDTRGMILTKMPGRLAEARRDYEDILRLSASDVRHHAKALLQLVRICVEVGDRGPARQYRDRLLEVERKTRILTPEEREEILETVHESDST